MTETSPVCTRSYRRAELRDAGKDEKCRRATMVSVPVPFVELCLRGDESEQQRDGKAIGDVQVRGPFITGSYREVAVTPDKFTEDGWLHTGDVA